MEKTITVRVTEEDWRRHGRLVRKLRNAGEDYRHWFVEQEKNGLRKMSQKNKETAS